VVPREQPLVPLGAWGVFILGAILAKLRNFAYGLIYRAAYQARAIVWGIQKPTLLGVRALVIREDQVLLIRHRAGKKPWSLPGGGVDKHERMAEAARREVYEESGISVRVERLFGLYDAFHGEYPNYIAVYHCTPLHQGDLPASIEIAEVAFFSLKQLPHDLEEGSRRRIAEFVAGKSGLSDLW
jgi:8-oxo-dGTP diphosphatase